MLIFRYLAKEVFITLFALITILLIIFLSNQFVRYLGRAAIGHIPVQFIFKVLALELPLFMGLLLPLGLYMAILLAYGRLYADSEMTVLHACGYGTFQLIKHSLVLALGVALSVWVVLLWVNPSIAIERAKLLRSEGIQVFIQTLVPERFSVFQNGKSVAYVQHIANNHQHAGGIFLAHLDEKKSDPQWDILWAERADIKMNPSSGAHEIVLKQGQIYQGQPGLANYRKMSFDTYQTPLPEPEISMKSGDLRSVKTSALWPPNGDTHKLAELQWRFSLPFMVIILTLIAVPMSRVHPRMGKFAKVLPAVILFIIYANLLFTSKDAISSGKISYWLGTIGLHGLFLCIGLGLIWRSRLKFG